MTIRPVAEPTAVCSLYDTLGEPAPWPLANGETQLTATKETVDNDTEDVSDDDVIHG